MALEPAETKTLFARRLSEAIKREGLTYREAAARVRDHLPPGGNLSGVTIWSYATGRTSPRRQATIEALSKALAVDLQGNGETSPAGEAGSQIVVPPAPSFNAEPMPAVYVVDAGEGQALLHVHQVLPWPLVIDLLQRLQQEAASSLDTA